MFYYWDISTRKQDAVTDETHRKIGKSILPLHKWSAGHLALDEGQ